MKHIPLFKQFLNEKTSGEIFNPKRNKVVKFDYTKWPELADEFFDLISIAYQELGGHSKVKSTNDVFSDPDWNYWKGIDLHGTQDFDMIMFGKKTKWGVKYSGVGHDGSSAAKRSYISTRGAELKTLGYYIEVSGKIANILINDYGVPIVTDQETVEKVLGKPVKWIGNKPGEQGNGWYTRLLGGKNNDKILLGRPKM
jgi:hypothetical protein